MLWSIKVLTVAAVLTYSSSVPAEEPVQSHRHPANTHAHTPKTPQVNKKPICPCVQGDGDFTLKISMGIYISIFSHPTFKVVLLHKLHKHSPCFWQNDV